MENKAGTNFISYVGIEEHEMQVKIIIYLL